MLNVERDLRREMKKRSTIASIFGENAKKFGDKIAYIDAETNKKLSFTELDRLSNRVANYFHDQGLKKGDVVAIFMNNRVDYVAIWLGLSKLGVVSALINYNLRLQPLGHCVSIAKAKCLIFDSELQSGTRKAKRVFPLNLSIICLIFQLSTMQ